MLRDAGMSARILRPLFYASFYGRFEHPEYCRKICLQHRAMLSLLRGLQRSFYAALSFIRAPFSRIIQLVGRCSKRWVPTQAPQVQLLPPSFLKQKYPLMMIVG